MKNAMGICVLKDGSHKKRFPSEMEAYQCMPKEDAEAFVNWAYNPPKPIQMDAQ